MVNNSVSMAACDYFLQGLFLKGEGSETQRHREGTCPKDLQQELQHRRLLQGALHRVPPETQEHCGVPGRGPRKGQSHRHGTVCLLLHCVMPFHFLLFSLPSPSLAISPFLPPPFSSRLVGRPIIDFLLYKPMVTEESVRSLISQLLDGVGYLHSHSILHLDIRVGVIWGLGWVSFGTRVGIMICSSHTTASEQCL